MTGAIDMTTPVDREEEVRANFDAFQKLLPQILETHAGKFALIRHGDVVEYFDSARDAFVYGMKQYDDELFSVQEVTTRVVDLGWFSYASHHTSA